MTSISGSGAYSILLREYVIPMRNLIIAPKQFFQEYTKTEDGIRPLLMVTASSTFYAFASLLTYNCPQTLTALFIFFVNAMGTLLLSSGIGYTLLRVLLGRPLSYTYIFGVYAYAWSVILLIAWIPYLLLVVEVWRWWLISTGLVIVWGVKRWESVLVVGITIGCMVFGYKGAMSWLI